VYRPDLHEPNGPPKHRAESSCRFNGNQLVSYIVHLDQPGAYGALFKVQSDCFENVGSQFFPRLAFIEEGVTQRARAEAAVLSVANLEGQLHALFRITKAVDSRLGSVR
jgi:hypothetical protein